jgi:hypothetical protein
MARAYDLQKTPLRMRNGPTSHLHHTFETEKRLALSPPLAQWRNSDRQTGLPFQGLFTLTEPRRCSPPSLLLAHVRQVHGARSALPAKKTAAVAGSRFV